MRKGKRILPILFVTLLLDAIGLAMIIPIIPVIFIDTGSTDFLLHGYSESARYLVAGIVTALYGLVQFFAAPILGELSDAYGRKKLLMAGIGVLAISQLFFGLGIETGSLALLIVSRIIGGLAAGNFSIAQASIADVTEPKDRAKNFGLIGAAFGIAFVLGPALAGWIAGATGDAASPFWLAGVLGIMNLLFVLFTLPETRIVSKDKAREFHIFLGIRNIRSAFTDKDARPVYLASFCYLSGFAFMSSFFGVLLVAKFGLGEVDVGTFYSVVGIWVAVTQLFILRIVSSHYSERTILKYCLLLVALALFLHPFMPSPLLLFLLIPFYSIPHALTMANLTALISRSVSADKQGAALGINGSLFAFTQGVIPILAGTATGLIGLTAPFIAGAIFVAVAWGVLFALR